MRLSERIAAQENGGRTERRTARRPAVRSGADDRAQSVRRTVHERVLYEIGPRLSGPKAIPGDALEDELRSTVDRVLASEDIDVSAGERHQFVEDLLSDILGFGPLDELLADPQVTEIMCNGYDQIWVERDGRIERTDAFFVDATSFRQVIERIVAGVGRRVDESSPMVDARLADGSRVNAIIPPLAIHGPALTIRKFPQDAFTIKDLVGWGALTMDVAMFLEAAVRGRLNILISGGTATGKTTLLNAVSGFLPDTERIVTIEDAAELRLQQPHVVSLEARPANAEGRGEVTIRDLVKNALATPSGLRCSPGLSFGDNDLAGVPAVHRSI